MQGSDRGQAYTLEGFIGSILILTAVLFAINAVVITPTTAGSVDRDARDQVRTQAQDMLELSKDSGNLSKLIRYWNVTGNANDHRFAASDGLLLGYNSKLPPKTAPRDLLVLLNDTFQDKNGYTVIATYQGPNGEPVNGTLNIVGPQGIALETSVVATVTVTLYDDQRLTGPGGEQKPLWAYPASGADGDYYPIPDAYPNSPVYNVVTVKVIVW
jgi:hypothetical protein